jgi:hypothetical protein
MQYDMLNKASDPLILNRTNPQEIMVTRPGNQITKDKTEKTKEQEISGKGGCSTRFKSLGIRNGRPN